MGIRRGEITTKIVSDGLVFNMDAANRASTIPVSTVETSFNTVNLSQSGSFSDNGIFDSSTITPSFAFGGTDDKIDLNEKFDFIQSTGKFSVNVWIKITEPGSNSLQSIIGSNYTGANVGWYFFHDDRSSQGYDKRLRFQYAIGSGTHINVDNEPVIQNTNWHMVTATADSTTLRVYFNGSQLSTTGTIPGVTSTTAHSNTRIAANTLNDGGNFWNGNIGPIHIYNRALSAEEVLSNYNGLRGRFGV
jgi:hypothetical protein